MRRIIVSLTAVALCVGSYAQAPLNEARILMGDYRAALTLAQQAAADQNQQEHQANLKKATETLSRALLLFEEGKVMEVGDAAAMRDYAAAQNAAGNADQAARALGRATELASHDAGLWLEYGEAMGELGPNAFITAKQAFDAAHQKASEPGMRANALAGSGALFYRHGYFDVARAQFEDALLEEPDLPRAIAGLAACQLRDGEVLAASRGLESIAPMAPALEKESKQMIETAIQGFWKARLHYEDTPENHVAYARLLIQANYPSSAIAPLKRAAKLAPDSTLPLNMLGLLLSGMGDSTTAEKTLQASLAIDSDQPRIQDFLNTLRGQRPAPESALPIGIAAPPQ